MAFISAEHVQFLQTHELKYEIELRGGHPKKSRDDRRQQLRVIFRREKCKLDPDTISPLSFEDDLHGIKLSLTSLQEDVSKLSENSEPTVFKRISARLLHLSSRIDISVPKDAAQKLEKQQLEEEICAIEGEFLDKEETFRIASLSIKTPPVSPTPASASAPSTSTVPNSAAVPLYRVPVHKWNVSFSGEINESLTSFLERVSELREARNVSNSELFSSAVDLFSGPALIWFRSIKHTVDNWQSLVEKLRDTFLPSDYNDELLAEIRKRTQGEKENVILFIAQMQGLFAKLTPKPTETEQIKIIRKNLLPYFLGQLALHKISSISELTSLCKQLSETRTLMDKYHPPTQQNHCLAEPSLSYSHASEPVNTSEVRGDNVSDFRSPSSAKCWNCRRSGHIYSECRSPKSRFCYGCGRPNTYKPKCPTCNPSAISSPKNDHSENSRDATSRPQQGRPLQSAVEQSTGAIKKNSAPR